MTGKLAGRAADADADFVQGRSDMPMSDPQATDNSQMFDLATGLDTLAIGVSPSQSFAMLDAVMAQALGMAMYNAVSAQQNASTVRAAAVTMACAGLLSLPVAESDKHPAGAVTGQPGLGQPAPVSTMPTPSVFAPSADGSTAKVDPESASPERVDPSVNPQVIDAINRIQQAPPVVRASGAGKAYQLVAQSAAIAVQDAAEALRGISTIAATASAVAMTRFLTTADPKYLAGVAAAQDMVKLATEDFRRVGDAAAEIMEHFPSG